MFEFVAETAGVGVVETAMFSTISALLLLVLEVASEVTTTELAAEAGTVEAAVEAEAAVVNTVTAADWAAEPTAAATEPPAAEAETAAACALAAVVEACDATEAADKVGWGCFLEDEGLLDPHEEAVEELLDNVVLEAQFEAAATAEAEFTASGGGGPDDFSILFSMGCTTTVLTAADGLRGSRVE